MTDRALAGCAFCGGKQLEMHHNGSITFMLCGDEWARGGCGAVVSFRPNLAGSAAIAAWNRRAPSRDEVRDEFVQVRAETMTAVRNFVSRYTSGNSVPRDLRFLVVRSGPTITEEAAYLQRLLAPNAAIAAAEGENHG